MILVLPGGRLFVTLGEERREVEEDFKRLPHQVALATLIILTIDLFLHRTKWLLAVIEDMEVKVGRHPTSPVLRTTLVILTVGLFLHRARWHFFAEMETIVGEEEEGEVKERPRHQAPQGLGGGDMTTAAIALKYLVIITTIDLALLKAMQHIIVGEVNMEVEETVEV